MGRVGDAEPCVQRTAIQNRTLPRRTQSHVQFPEVERAPGQHQHAGRISWPLAHDREEKPDSTLPVSVAHQRARQTHSVVAAPGFQCGGELKEVCRFGESATPLHGRC